MKLTRRQRQKLMGQVVTVKKFLRRSYMLHGGLGKGWRVIDQCSGAIGRAGWVVGFGVVREGTGGNGPDWEDWQFITKRSIPCMKVAFQPHFRPVMVPIEDGAWEVGGVPDAREFKWEPTEPLERGERGRFR